MARRKQDRRISRMEDRHRREMIALKREVVELVFTLLRPPEIEILTLRQLQDRLTGEG